MSRNANYDYIIWQLKSKFSDSIALNILDNMQKVYEAKDNDYSSTGLPMGNLRKCEDAGIDAWRGCLVRMGDKISRLENFLKQQEYKVDEKAEDTIIDLANYSILMSCLLKEILGDCNLNKYHISITESATKDLFNLSYYCVFQAMLWKDNNSANDSSKLEKVLTFWKKLCDYSLEMV